MDTTLGDPEAISGTTVDAVLNATLGSIRSQLLEQLAAGESAREATEHEAQAAAGRADAAERRATLALRQASHANAALHAFRQAQVNRAKRKPARWARRVEVAAFAVLTALVVGSAVASLAGSIQLPFIAVPPGLRWPARILFLALLVVGTVLSVVSLVTGWSVSRGCWSSSTGLSLDSRRTIWMSFLPRGPTANSQSPADPLHEACTQPSCLRMYTSENAPWERRSYST
jgi:hypothetical protein